MAVTAWQHEVNTMSSRRNIYAGPKLYFKLYFKLAMSLFPSEEHGTTGMTSDIQRKKFNLIRILFILQVCSLEYNMLSYMLSSFYSFQRHKSGDS